LGVIDFGMVNLAGPMRVLSDGGGKLYDFLHSDKIKMVFL
jgi:hypothetical protein